MGFASGYIAGRIITADIISLLSGIFRLVFALLKIVFQLIKWMLKTLYQGVKFLSMKIQDTFFGKTRKHVINSKHLEPETKEHHNFLDKLKPLRGLGLFLLINSVAYVLALAGVGTGLVAGLVYILIFIGSFIFCFRMTLRDIKERIRERKLARFNRNFEQACNEVNDMMHLTPTGPYASNEYFRIWDVYSHRLFDNMANFLYSKKGFLSKNLYLQSVPSCATLVSRLITMAEDAQTLHISQRDRMISFNCGRPVNFDDILEVQVVIESTTRRDSAYAHKTSNRDYTKTYVTTDKTNPKYSLMITLNRLEQPHQSLSFGLDRESAYKVNSLIKVLKCRQSDVDA